MTTPKFAIFDHIEDIPGTPTSQLFKDRLALIQTADEAGFAGYHLAEHHGGGLCMAGEVSTEDSRFYDFPPMPLQTKPYQERIPFWYPGSPQTAGRHGMSLMWPGKIDQGAYEQYLAAWHDYKDDDIRMDGPDDRPRVGYSMLLAIAPTDDEARDIARRGMEGLIRRTRDCHRFDRLVLSEDECEAAQGPLRAIIANMDVAIEFGAGTPGRIAENLAMLLQGGMADYICLMFPAGDMTIEESRRTLELFVTEVQPQLQQQAVGG